LSSFNRSAADDVTPRWSLVHQREIAFAFYDCRYHDFKKLIDIFLVGKWQQLAEKNICVLLAASVQTLARVFWAIFGERGFY
jgi:hypothetical protein